MDLFEEKDVNKGFKADVAKELVHLWETNYPAIEYMMYPFNFIKSAAFYGKTEIILNILPVSDAQRLKDLGYEVNYKIETGKWKISWK
ncbi:MAG: hypothetical protein WD512_17925 [Candidatus Paceibacterota bacterium]